MRIENSVIEKLNKLNFTIEYIGETIILNLVDDYKIQEYYFILDIIQESENQSQEVQFLLDPDQLILDFSKLNYIDQTGGEFLVLNDTYEKLKRKAIIFCGISEQIESTLKLISEEGYLELIRFDTREQAIEYYHSQKNKNN